MIVIQTDVLCVTIFSTRTAAGSTWNARNTRSVRTIIPAPTVVVDTTCRSIADADIIGTDFPRRTIAVDRTSKFVSHTDIVDTSIPRRTVWIVVARVRFLTDGVLSVANESRPTVTVCFTADCQRRGRADKSRESDDETHCMINECDEVETDERV